jgi:hypothetical protein
MSYLEQLKSENTHPDALPKLPKGAFGCFGCSGGRHFSEKKAQAATDINTGDNPRFTDAAIYQGEPDRAAVDLADRILDFIVAQPGPVPEAEIVTAIGGDSLLVRNVVRRLAVEGIAEALPGGLYGIPPWPPAAPDLPRGCPLTGAPFPATGCRFHRRLFARLVAEGALPTGGPCPLRRVCKLERGE